jgi:hypothetical protein
LNFDGCPRSERSEPGGTALRAFVAIRVEARPGEIR